jgi:hypothetical protein
VQHGDKRQQKQVAQRSGIAVRCRVLQKFGQDTIGRVGSVALMVAGVQVGDEVRGGRKCGQQRARIGELVVARFVMAGRAAPWGDGFRFIPAKDRSCL